MGNSKSSYTEHVSKIKDEEIEVQALRNALINKYDDVDFIKFMLQGADPTFDHNFPIRHALENNHEKIVKLLMQKPYYHKILEKANQEKDMVVVNACLEFLQKPKEIPSQKLEKVPSQKTTHKVGKRQHMISLLESYNSGSVRHGLPNILSALNTYNASSPSALPSNTDDKNIDGCTSGFDLIDQRYTNIIEYLSKGNDRIVIFIGQESNMLVPFLTTFSYLAANIEYKLFSSCNKKSDGKYKNNNDHSIFLLSNPIMFVKYPIYLSNLIDVLKTDKQAFVLLPIDNDETGYLVERSTSKGETDPDCTNGTDLMMYSIQAVSYTHLRAHETG
jgi:hypothetical protein